MIGRFAGVVRNQIRGWGFIECDVRSYWKLERQYGGRTVGSWRRVKLLTSPLILALIAFCVTLVIPSRTQSVSSTVQTCSSPSVPLFGAYMHGHILFLAFNCSLVRAGYEGAFVRVSVESPSGSSRSGGKFVRSLGEMRREVLVEPFVSSISNSGGEAMRI